MYFLQVIFVALCRKTRLFLIKSVNNNKYQILTINKETANFLQFVALQRAFTENSLRAYRVDLAQLLAHSPAQVNESDLKSLFSSLMTHWANLSPATRQRKCACLKSFAHWLYSNGRTTVDWGNTLTMPKRQLKIPHFVSVDEALQLFRHLQQAVTENSPNSRRNLALLGLLYGGGMRVGEACAIAWQDIDMTYQRVRTLGKGRKERWVVLPKNVIAALAALPKDHKYLFGDEPFSTRTAYNIVRAAGARAGLLRPLHPHALRHSFATHLLNGGTNLRVLQELLGHSSLAATQKYLHLSTDELARTMERFHPLGKAQDKK